MRGKVTVSLSPEDRVSSSSTGDRTGSDADRAASGRDLAAASREIVSDARDDAAAERDRAAVQLENDGGAVGPEFESAIKHAAEVRAQAAADRNLAAADREQAEIDREEAAIDRRRAAADREQAALDREQAAIDRQMAVAELERSHLDDLTGAYRRGAGELALESEIARARRADESLVLAFVDVDGLKAVNDHRGHVAADGLLRDVVNAMRSKMRSYEPIVRFGGDEFVCSVAGVDIIGAKARFDEIAEILNQTENPGSVSVGLTELRADDTLDALIDRADAALIEVRGG